MPPIEALTLTDLGHLVDEQEKMIARQHVLIMDLLALLQMHISAEEYEELTRKITEAK